MQGVRRAIGRLRILFTRDFHLQNHHLLPQRRTELAYTGLARSVFGRLVQPSYNGSELHDAGLSSKLYCTQITTPQLDSTSKQKKGTRPSGDPQKLYNEIVVSLEKKITPFPKSLQELIRCSSSPSEVALAMKAAELLRIFYTVDLKETRNHSKEVTHMMVAAFLRSNDAHNAIKLLKRQGPAGFTSSIGSAHLLLKHSKFHKDVGLMRRILRAMEANDIRATQTTADIILRQCKDAGETELLFSLAKKYNLQGLTFHTSILDVLISCAANAGEVQLVKEIQSWREKQGLVHTTASAISVAKALVLERKGKDAAVVIKEACPEGEKRERYLMILVKVWPLQLVASRDVGSRDEYLVKLKEDVGLMFERLRELGLEFSIDVSKDFAQGKGSDSKAQREVKSTNCELSEDL